MNPKIISLFFVLGLASINANKVCHSNDDPHMRTFDGMSYEFHYQGDHFILYDDFKDTRVTAGYQKCGSYATCNCAVYIKKGTKLMFVDFCFVQSQYSPTSKLYGVTVESNSVGLNALRQVPTCPIISPLNEDNEQTWSNIPEFLGKFKCARLQGSNHYDYFVIRTIERKFSNSVKVKFQLANRRMPTLSIQAAQASFKNTGGLCGMWDNDQNKELYLLDKDGVEDFISNTNQNIQVAAEFWKLQSRFNKDQEETNSGLTKRCPECFLMSERSYYCPCDNFDLFDITNYNIQHPNRTTYCKVPMFQCVEKFNDFFDPTLVTTTRPPLVSTTTTSQLLGNDTSEESNSTSPDFELTTTLSPTTTARPIITIEEANEICWQGFMNNTALAELINSECLEPAFELNLCALDLVTTGDFSFIDMHVQILIDSAIQNILVGANNCTVTGIDQLCPNNCSGHGVCQFKPECLKNPYSISEECLSPVKCDCEEPYGGFDCSQDLTNIPGITIAKECCDLRKEKCDLVTATGFPFNTKDKIYAKIHLIEYSSTGEERLIEEYTTALALTSTNLQIKLNKLNELSLFKNIFNQSNNFVAKESVAYAKVYVSYINSSFSETAASTFRLYDSKCRTCLSNQPTSLLQDSCEIEGKCYAANETSSSNQYLVCNPSENASNWTVIDPECNGRHVWTEWYNMDAPSGDGDLELFNLVDYGIGCTNPTKTQVQTVDGVHYDQTGQIVHLNNCFGFMCLNKENNNSCLDYRFRQCCPFNEIRTTTRPPTTTTTTTISTKLPLETTAEYSQENSEQDLTSLWSAVEENTTQSLEEASTTEQF